MLEVASSNQKVKISAPHRPSSLLLSVLVLVVVGKMRSTTTHSCDINSGCGGGEEERTASTVALSLVDEEHDICWLCHGPDADEPLRRDCSCRGGSGWAHFPCILGYASHKMLQWVNILDGAEEFTKPWRDCPCCQQYYRNELALDLAKELVSFVKEAYPNDQQRYLVALQLKHNALVSMPTGVRDRLRLQRTNEAKQIANEIQLIENSRARVNLAVVSVLIMGTLLRAMHLGFYMSPLLGPLFIVAGAMAGFIFAKYEVDRVRPAEEIPAGVQWVRRVGNKVLDPILDSALLTGVLLVQTAWNIIVDSENNDFVHVAMSTMVDSENNDLAVLILRVFQLTWLASMMILRDQWTFFQ